jgi:hypothetical protein
MSFFKMWELFFSKKTRFFVCDANAANPRKIIQNVAA